MKWMLAVVLAAATWCGGVTAKAEGPWQFFKAPWSNSKNETPRAAKPSLFAQIGDGVGDVWDGTTGAVKKLVPSGKSKKPPRRAEIVRHEIAADELAVRVEAEGKAAAVRADQPAFRLDRARPTGLLRVCPIRRS